MVSEKGKNQPNRSQALLKNELLLLYLFKAKFNRSEIELNNRNVDWNQCENAELFSQTKNDLIERAWIYWKWNWIKQTPMI